MTGLAHGRPCNTSGATPEPDELNATTLDLWRGAATSPSPSLAGDARRRGRRRSDKGPDPSAGAAAFLPPNV